MNPLKHVAIIMDGNGRWGLKKKNSRNFGHKKGLETVEKIISAAINKYTYVSISKPFLKVRLSSLIGQAAAKPPAL